MWALIFTLILLMALLVKIKDNAANNKNLLNILLFLTTILLVYALGQELYFN